MSQVRFEDDSTWLTGSGDAVLDLRRFGRDSVTPVDVKSKNHDVVQEMQLGRRSYETKHYNQLQAYIYLCNLFHRDMGWEAMGLAPAQGGYIYYASRQNPSLSHAFFVEIDTELIEQGVALLQEWRQSYLNDELPARPKDWKWTEEPCKWCPMKKYVCKPDNKEKITNLRDSNAISFAHSLREKYNYDEIKEETIKRWDR
jgi:CRISPR/Cas system-associated exonuclease Cas4 (RecB family)